MHHTLLHLNTIMLGEDYKLCILYPLRADVTQSLLDPHIFLCMLYSRSITLQFRVNIYRKDGVNKI
jgi:hypothetical protein